MKKPSFDSDETDGPRRRPRLTRRRITTIAIVAVVLIGGGGGSYLLLRPTSTSAAAFAQTFTAEVEESDQTTTVDLSGTISPKTQSELNFAVAGTVTKVYVSAGDKVKKGQELARVDASDLKNALALAKANLNTAQANLDDVSSSGTSAAISAAKAQVKSAKAAVTSAKQDVANAVLRSSITGTVASVDVAVGDTVSASGSSSSGTGSTGSKSTGSKSTGSSNASTSSTTSSAAVSVISTAHWKLDATVASTDLGSLKAGQVVAVNPSGAAEPLSGKVASVGIVATSTSDGSATFPVTVTIDGEHADLYSGTSATGTVTIDTAKDVLTVPTAAIKTADGASTVTKLDGEATTTVNVKVGRVFGRMTEITSGLAEGDTVQISFTPRVQSSTGANGDRGGFTGGFPGGPPDGGGRGFSGGAGR